MQDTIKNSNDVNWLRIQAYRNPDYETAEGFLLNLTKAGLLDQIDFSGFNLRDINFSNARFDQQVIFSGAKFEGHMSFQRARFDNLVDFDECEFASVANFERVEFRSSSTFSKATFAKYANFRGLKASGEILFHDATFSNGICFEELNCVNRVEFTGSNFADQKSEDLPLFRFQDNLNVEQIFPIVNSRLWFNSRELLLGGPVVLKQHLRM